MTPGGTVHPIERLGWSICADPMTPGERGERVEVLRGVREGLRERGERRLLCHVQMCLAVHETFRGEPEVARPLLDEALALADPDADRTQFLSVLQTEGTYWLHVGNAARAVEACLRMVREADRGEVRRSFQIKSRLNLAYALSCLGEVDGARRFCQEGMDLARQTGEVRRLGEAAAITAVCLLDAGDLPGAVAVLAEARAWRGGDVDARARALFGAVDVAAALVAEDWETARVGTDTLLDSDHMGAPDDRILVFGFRTRLLLAGGDAAAALEWSDRAHALAERAAHGPRVAASSALRVRVLHRLGRVDDMFAEVDRAARLSGAGSGRLLWHTLAARLDELHHLREVELEATNAALRRLHRKEAEERARAEAAARSRHLFLSSMSHEMRTPLTGVLGALGLIEQGVSTDEREHLLGIARRSAGLTLQIIDDILDLGRLESGQLSLDLGAFPLERSVRDVLAIVTEQARQADVTLDVELDPALPGRVRGDARRLKQVLLNLVANAVKFAAGGRVEVRVLSRTDGVRFEVNDDGIGIPVDVQGQLFEPFIQAGPGISRGFGGTGLGLSICRAIVHAFGGTIGVESELGAGARFWFEVPLLPVVASELPTQLLVPPVPAASPIVGMHVLIVEDNAVNRELAAMTLELQGARVSTAEDGVAAVQFVDGHSPDLVLMDMHMPRMGGIAATRHLRASGYEGPVVALTAAVLPEDRQAALDAGMDAFATKPIDRAQLFGAIRSALESRQEEP